MKIKNKQKVKKSRQKATKHKETNKFKIIPSYFDSSGNDPNDYILPFVTPSV